MNVLILSGNTGAGHNSCAKAIKQCFDAHGDTCVIEDGLAYISQAGSEFLSRWHTRIYRHMPGIFREGYEYGEEHPEKFKEEALFKLLAPGAERLRQSIVENGYDTVLCTHVIPGLVLTVVQKENPLPIRTAFLATDYTCSPTVDKCGLDLYFIPHENLIPEFAACGVPVERLVVTGIPVRQDFCAGEDKAGAKEKVGLRPDQAHLLVMCGSMGCGPIRELVELLQGRMTETTAVTVVCGTNQSLYKKLLELPECPENLRILEFTDQVSLLMDSADLYLTKPGGISVTEAAVKGLPMVFVDAVAGCEEHNLNFFLAHGGALTASEPEQLTELCLRMLADKRTRDIMESNLKSLSPGNGAERIYQALAN